MSNPAGKFASAKGAILTLWIVQLAMFLSGCVAYQVGGEIQRGRRALLYGDPKVALGHFQRAAELDPDYLTNFTILEQGVWTYVGRSHYAMGNNADARRVLERARSRHGNDNLAKLYLGLILVRDGDRRRGLGEIEAALKGLSDWFDYIERYDTEGSFWDPGRPIRSEIQRDLAMIGGKDIKWPDLIASGEWLGRELEQEIDRARRDRREERKRHRDNGEGPTD